jgi:hypothetical protein
MPRSSHRASCPGIGDTRKRNGWGAQGARLRAAVPFLAIMCLASSDALPQGIDCAGLRSQIAALDEANARTNPYLAQAQQQRADLQRSVSYAHSIGCDRQQFFFFGSPPPPQCGGLNAHIQQVQASVGQLEANARASASPERQQLAARFYAYCRTADAAPHSSGFFESLFGGQSAPNAQPQDPLEEVPAPGDETPQGGSEVLCVRHCDGYFFPLSYSERGGPDSLTDFCKASCPNAEVSVYTRVPGQEIETAVGLDGKPYTDLPTALKYQKSLDPACTCRAASASWADTLGDAERILNYGGRRDVMVTPQQSAAMARPKPDPRAKQAPVIAAPDDIEATDAAAAAQVPTAGTDSAGIATGDVKNGTAYSQGQGQTVEVTGPDGVKRRVRIVGPQL